VGLLFICYALAMRSAPKSEQEKLEIEAAERTDRRKGAFKYMNIRDRGWGQINDLNNKRSADHALACQRTTRRRCPQASSPRWGVHP
jgi:hypothetical protein